MIKINPPGTSEPKLNVGERQANSSFPALARYRRGRTWRLTMLNPLTMAAELLIPLIAVAGFAGITAFAWRYTHDPDRQPTVQDEAARLRNHASWLESRLKTAQREAWATEMEQQIAGQLAATRTELETTGRKVRGVRCNLP